MTHGQESGGILDAARETAAKKVWVTLTGLPLTIKLDWPFHRSTSGADFWVLHGDLRLEGAEGQHAPVAVNLSQTVREVMPSLEPADAEAPVINACCARKWTASKLSFEVGEIVARAVFQPAL